MNEIIQKREKWSKEEQGSNHKTTPIFFICYTHKQMIPKKLIKSKETHSMVSKTLTFPKEVYNI